MKKKKEIKIIYSKLKSKKGKIGVSLEYEGKKGYGKTNLEALDNLAKKLDENDN